MAARGSRDSAAHLQIHGTQQGEQARRAAVERLARGETADVTEGGQIFIDAPEIMRALAPPGRITNPVLTLAPGEPVPLTIEIRQDGTRFIGTIDLYQVPPPPGASGALAGYSGTVLIEAAIRLLEEPRIELQLGLSATFGDDIPANAQAAELHSCNALRCVPIRNGRTQSSGRTWFGGRTWT